MKTPTIYWRLRIVDDSSLRDMVKTSTAICPDADFLLRVAPGHGICLASFESASACGHVRAIGIANGADIQNRRIRVTWRETDLTLRPSSAGQRFWKDRPYFAFAKAVVNRYMLPAIFAEYFPELTREDSSERPPNPVVDDGGESTGAGDRGGFVYVIKSPYGCKIGKTRKIKQRSQLFSVKLPFPVELLHFGWFSDYSAAEARYHSAYADKRLEGEWFNLTAGDIAAIAHEMKA